LKLLGKRVVVIVTGSKMRSDALLLEDMRQNDAVSADHVRTLEAYLEETGGVVREEVNAGRATKVQRYADVVLSSGWDGLLLEQHALFRPPIDVSEFEYHLPEDDPPIVVHAPTRRELKGTKYVLAAVDALRDEGVDFEFMLLEDRPAAEVREILTAASIVIDQVVYPCHGLLAVEAMASGNAVMGSAIPGAYGLRDDLPVMTSTPATLTENLQELIENQALRRDLQQRGRRYAEQQHDYRRQCEYILNEIGVEQPRT